MIAAIFASCQRSFGSGPFEGTASVTSEALLAPGIAIDVIAAELPEAGLVVFGELQADHPFRRLPEIEMRHEEPRRSAMVGAAKACRHSGARSSLCRLRDRRPARWWNSRRRSARG